MTIIVPLAAHFNPLFALKKYNVGIIGYGWAATAHIDAINASGMAQVTNVYSSRLLDDDELSSRHGSKITSTVNLKSLLKNPENI